MPAAAPVVRLGPAWLAGEAIGLTLGLVPAQLLARWTLQDRRLGHRACFQAVACSGLLGLVLPAIAIDGSGTRWTSPATYPMWAISLIVQVLAVPAVIV
jgi:hypothetical protein